MTDMIDDLCLYGRIRQCVWNEGVENVMEGSEGDNVYLTVTRTSIDYLEG